MGIKMTGKNNKERPTVSILEPWHNERGLGKQHVMVLGQEFSIVSVTF